MTIMHTGVHCLPLTLWRTYKAHKRAPWTYIIGGGEFVKIGSAIEPLKRMKELQTGCPFELKLLAVTDKYEYGLHEEFQEFKCRETGEWFHSSCGSIMERIIDDWIGRYGDNETLDLHEAAETIHVSVKWVDDWLQYYGFPATKGAWGLLMDECSNVRKGVRLF